MVSRHAPLVWIACLAACTSRPPPSPAAPAEKTPPVAHEAAPSAKGGGPVDVEAFELKIAETACTRVQRCGGIGPLAAFASRQDCVAYLFTNAGLEPLGITACESGATAQNVARCVLAIREQDCEEASTPSECLPPALCGPTSK